MTDNEVCLETPSTPSCAPTARRDARAAVGLTLFATAALGMMSPAARADAPAAQGWWTVANPGSPAPAAPPPDVPADGLLVQGGPDGAPAALSALVYLPPTGSSVSKLLLKVTSGSGTTPGASLQLCPLAAPSLHAEQGGPMADAPTYTCARTVTSPVSADGTSYSFDVTKLLTSSSLAVAILPVVVTDRVVLDKPGADSLVVSTPKSTADTGTVPAPASTPAAPLSDALASSVAIVPPLTATAPVIDAPTTQAAPVAPAVAVPDEAAPAESLARIASTALPRVASSPSWGPAVLVGGCLVTGLLWVFAGRRAGRELEGDDAATA